MAVYEVQVYTAKFFTARKCVWVIGRYMIQCIVFLFSGSGLLLKALHRVSSRLADWWSEDEWSGHQVAPAALASIDS